MRLVERRVARARNFFSSFASWRIWRREEDSREKGNSWEKHPSAEVRPERLDATGSFTRRIYVGSTRGTRNDATTYEMNINAGGKCELTRHRRRDHPPRCRRVAFSNEDGIEDEICRFHEYYCCLLADRILGAVNGAIQARHTD